MNPFSTLRCGITLSGVLCLSWLSGCAAPEKRQPVSGLAVQVRVVSSWPMSDPVAQSACIQPPTTSQHQTPQPAPDVTPQGYCLVYEHSGQTYSVWLPSDPGEHLTLQLPSVAPAAIATLTPAQVPSYTAVSPPYPLVYPGVFYVGTYYRPRPYAMPVRPVPGLYRGPYSRRHGH
jgi:hypothetical protein